MSEFKIVTLHSGIKSLRSQARGETFHPVTGPRAEANILHVKQQRLIERCRRATKFVIWDVGFGAGANALAALESLADCDTEIEMHSFDKTIAPIEFALVHARELEYVTAHEDRLRSLLAGHFLKISPSVIWRLHLGDFVEQMKRESLPAPHAIFYDPYSPAANPEMWTLEHFCHLRSRLENNAPCLLTNYTRSTAVRVTLLLAGFFVGKGCGVGEKNETTIATNHFNLLAKPLDQSWLARVRNSTNAAPLRETGDARGRIADADFVRLEAHAQFAF